MHGAGDLTPHPRPFFINTLVRNGTLAIECRYLALLTGNVCFGFFKSTHRKNGFS